MESTSSVLAHPAVFFDLAELLNVPGQPAGGRHATPEALDLGPADYQIVQHLWAYARAGTSSIAIVRDRHRALVRKYIRLHRPDFAWVVEEPITTEDELRSVLKRPEEPFLVSISVDFPADGLDALDQIQRRSCQVVILDKGDRGSSGAFSRAREYAMRAMQGDDVPWVPDVLTRSSAVAALCEAASARADDAEARTCAEQLAGACGERIVGLIPLGRWLAKQDQGTGVQRLRALADEVDRSAFRQSRVRLGMINGRMPVSRSAALDRSGLAAVLEVVTTAALRQPDGAPAANATSIRCLLDFAACADARAIPLELVASMADAGRSLPEHLDALRRISRALAAYGLASVDEHESPSSLSLASAHQEVLRNRLADRAGPASDGVSTVLERALDAPDRSGDLVRHALAVCEYMLDNNLYSLATANLLRSAMSQFRDVPASNDPTAKIDYAWGLSARIEDLVSRSVDAARWQDGQSSESTAAALRNRAWWRRNHGQADGAVKDGREAVAIIESLPAEARISQLPPALLVLGTSLYASGQAEASLQTLMRLTGEAVEGSVLVVDQTTQMLARVNTARVEIATGRLRSALNRLNDLDSELAASPDGYPRSVRWNSDQNRALALVLLGRHDAAERVLVGLIAERKEHLGNDHPDALQTRLTYARLKLAMGQPLTAKNLALEVAEARARILGPDNPATISAQLLVVRATIAAGCSASDAAEDVARHRLRRLGLDHPATRLADRVVAESYMAEGRPAEALRLLDQIAADPRRRPEANAVDPDPLEPLEIQQLRLRARATLALWSDRPSELMAISREFSDLASAIAREVGQTHPMTMQLRLFEAWSRAKGGDSDGALDDLQPLSEDLVRIVGESHPITLGVRKLIVEILCDLEMADEAGRALRHLTMAATASELFEAESTGLKTEVTLLKARVAELGVDGAGYVRSSSPDVEELTSTALAALLVDPKSRYVAELDRGGVHAIVADPDQDLTPAMALQVVELIDRLQRTRGESIATATLDDAARNLLDESVDMWRDLASDDLYAPVFERVRLLTSARKRTGASRDVDPFSHRRTAAGIRLSLQLLIQPEALMLGGRRLADLAGVTESHVSNLLQALERRGFIERDRHGRGGRVHHDMLFDALAHHWRANRAPGQPGGGAVPILTPPEEWESVSGLATEHWVATGDLACAALGGPINVRADAQLELYVVEGPSRPGARPRSAKDQVVMAADRWGVAPSASAASVLLRVPLIPIPAVERTLPQLTGWKVAHPVIVALDLASSGERGPEIVRNWQPRFFEG